MCILVIALYDLSMDASTSHSKDDGDDATKVYLPRRLNLCHSIGMVAGLVIGAGIYVSVDRTSSLVEI